MNNKFVETLGTIVGYIIGSQLIAILSVVELPLTIWRGYVVSILWFWFVSPLCGYPPLSLGIATGLLLLVKLVTYRVDTAVHEKHSKWHAVLAGELFIPATLLLCGWIIHRWIA